MRLSVALFSIVLGAMSAGCDAPQELPEEELAPAPDDFDYDDESDMPGNWHEFGEVAGEDSYAEARLEMEGPVAGEPTKVEYLAGSFKGIPRGVRVWTRIGDPAVPKVYDNPEAGPEWIEMKRVKARVYNPLKQESDDVPLDYKTKGREQGEILYRVELTFPAGESLLEFKTLAASEGATEVGFEGWTVTAREAKPE